MGKKTTSLYLPTISKNIKNRMNQLGKCISTEPIRIKGEVCCLKFKMINHICSSSQLSSLYSVPNQGRRSNECGSYTCFFMQELYKLFNDNHNVDRQDIEAPFSQFSQMKRADVKKKVESFRKEICMKLFQLGRIGEQC